MKILTLVLTTSLFLITASTRAASVDINSFGALDIVQKSVHFDVNECMPGLYAGLPASSRTWLSFIRMNSDRSFERLAGLDAVVLPQRSTTIGNCYVNFLLTNLGTVNFGEGTGMTVRCYVSPIPTYAGPMTVETARGCLMKAYDSLGLAANPFHVMVMRSEH